MLKKRGEELYLEVYLDVIFIINFIMDLILLSIVKKILKWESSIGKRIIGAIVGAIGACILALFPELNHFTQFILSYLVICIVMIWITYQPRTWLIGVKGVVVLYLATFFLGGLFNSLYYHSMVGFYFNELINGRLLLGLNGWKLVMLIISGIIGIAMLNKILSSLGRGDEELYETNIYLKEKSISLTGLLDTGNNLYDPVFGKPVIVIEYNSIIKLLSEEQIEYINSTFINFKVTPITENISVFMIPFKSIGKKNGLLPAIKIDKLEIIKGEEKKCSENVLTGIWTGQLSNKNEYKLILHRDLM